MKPAGKVISLVGGATHGIWPFLRNSVRPRFLGGTPRTYKLLGLKPAGDLHRQVAKWVNEGLIKEVPIDSEYSMEDVLKVCISAVKQDVIIITIPQAYERVASKRSKGKVVVKIE